MEGEQNIFPCPFQDLSGINLWQALGAECFLRVCVGDVGSPIDFDRNCQGLVRIGICRRTLVRG